jgi:uncharacterized protein (TIGR00725 family)
MKKTIIGVMGPGSGATEEERQHAFRLGRLIAERGWVLLSGGRNEGVMDAVNKGAKSSGGLTIGILPSADDEAASEFVDVSIITGMGSARNNINILSSSVVIACGMGAGTASEIALALKAKKYVVLLTEDHRAIEFFASLDKDLVVHASDPEEAIRHVSAILQAL